MYSPSSKNYLTFASERLPATSIAGTIITGWGVTPKSFAATDSDNKVIETDGHRINTYNASYSLEGSCLTN